MKRVKCLQAVGSTRGAEVITALGYMLFLSRDVQDVILPEGGGLNLDQAE